MKRFKVILYYLSLVGPVVDILKGAWNAVVNISVESEYKRQKYMFMNDNIEEKQILTVELKEKKNDKSI